MVRLFSGISIIFFVLIQSCTPTMESKIDDMVDTYTEKDLFSGVVLYAEGRDILYQKPFGLANHEESQKNSIQTKFNIGSLNKDFTNVIILQLLADDSLKLDDPIGNYVDDFDKDILKRVTIRHLLRHEAGFGDYGMHPKFQENRHKFKSIDDLIKLFKFEPLLYIPGSDHYYSNSGFIVLGKIMENITGQSYADLLQERILDPLGIKNTHYADLDQVSDRAMGYIKSATGKLINTGHFEESASPAGGCYSTTGDLFKFYDALENSDILLTDPYKKLMYIRANPNVKLSWAEIAADPSFFSAKAGGLEGFNSMVIEWMAKGQITIVLANYDEPIAEDVGMGVFSIMKDLEPEKPKLPARQYVYQILQQYDYEFISTHYDSLMDLHDYQYDVPWLLNQVGYDLLHEKLFDEAIQIFKLNVKRYPEDSNSYDSLGEAYMLSGQKELAVENYKKSLELDPKNQNAVDMIAKLMGKN